MALGKRLYWACFTIVYGGQGRIYKNVFRRFGTKVVESAAYKYTYFFSLTFDRHDQLMMRIQDNGQTQQVHFDCAVYRCILYSIVVRHVTAVYIKYQIISNAGKIRLGLNMLLISGLRHRSERWLYSSRRAKIKVLSSMH